MRSRRRNSHNRVCIESLTETGATLGFVTAGAESRATLFSASYPITHRRIILHELSQSGTSGSWTFQAEDEIAADYFVVELARRDAGALAITTIQARPGAENGKRWASHWLSRFPGHFDIRAVDRQPSCRPGPSSRPAAGFIWAGTPEAPMSRTGGVTPHIFLVAIGGGGNESRIAVKYMVPLSSFDGSLCNARGPW